MKNNNKIQNELVNLYLKNNSVTSSQPWEWEKDRFKELVICSFISLGIHSKISRNLFDLLEKLNLTSPDTLYKMNDKKEVFILSVLNQCNINAVYSKKILATLKSIAKYVKEQYGGHVQKFLRKHAELIQKELSAGLVAAGLEKSTSNKTATLWLQNVTNMPLLFPGDPYIKKYCTKHKISINQLYNIADEAEINVAVLDDLLELEWELSAVS